MFSILSGIFVTKSCGLSRTLSDMCKNRDVFIEAMDTNYSRPAAFIMLLVYPVIFFVCEKLYPNFDWREGLFLIRICFSVGLIFLVYVWYTRRKIRVSLKKLALFICVEEDTLLKMDRDRISDLVKIYVLEAIVLMRVASRTSKFEDPEYVLLRNEASKLQNNTPWGALSFWGVEIGEEIPQTEELVDYVVSNIKRLGFWETYFNVQAYAKNIFTPYVKDDKKK